METKLGISLLLFPFWFAWPALDGVWKEERREDVPISVVVNRDNPVTELERGDLARIYLGRKTLWPSGARIIPLLVTEENPVTQFVIEEIVQKTIGDYRRYWRVRLFSGGGAPPITVRTFTEVVDFVATHPGAIGVVGEVGREEGIKVVSLKG